MTLIEQLAGWTLAFGASEPPAEVRQRAKLVLLDSLGCALAALPSEAAQATLRTVMSLGGAPACTVIGTALRTSVVNAVLANGVLIRALDLNDLYFRELHIGHPSDNLAVALSVGESQRSSGRELLSAIVMAYELYGRIRDLDHVDSPWDHTSASCLVAPAVAGFLLKLDAERLADALALNAARGPTLGEIRQGEITGAKNAANALVAADGTLAALLAANGLTGPRLVLEGPSGMGRNVFAGADLSRLVSPLEGEHRIMNVSVKAYPCFGTGQAVVAAALKARSLAGSPLPEVERIEVRLADLPINRKQASDESRWQPTTRESADHSHHFLVAVALIDAEFGPRQFMSERWLDPAVRSLIQKIDVRTDARLNRYTPGSFPCHLKLIVRGGKAHEVEMPYPPGHPKNIDSAIVESKFHACAEALLPQARRSAIIREIDALESCASVADLVELTRP